MKKFVVLCLVVLSCVACGKIRQDVFWVQVRIVNNTDAIIYYENNIPGDYISKDGSLPPSNIVEIFGQGRLERCFYRFGDFLETLPDDVKNGEVRINNQGSLTVCSLSELPLHFRMEEKVERNHYRLHCVTLFVYFYVE